MVFHYGIPIIFHLRKDRFKMKEFIADMSGYTEVDLKALEFINERFDIIDWEHEFGVTDEKYMPTLSMENVPVSINIQTTLKLGLEDNTRGISSYTIYPEKISFENNPYGCLKRKLYNLYMGLINHFISGVCYPKEFVEKKYNTLYYDEDRLTTSNKGSHPLDEMSKCKIVKTTKPNTKIQECIAWLNSLAFDSFKTRQDQEIVYDGKIDEMFNGLNHDEIEQIEKCGNFRWSKVDHGFEYMDTNDLRYGFLVILK